MSAQEIMAELPKLHRKELQLVKAQVDALVAGPRGLHSPGDSIRPTQEPARPGKEGLAEFLLRVAGTADGLPEDMAKNHDHYLYGTTKQHES